MLGEDRKQCYSVETKLNEGFVCTSSGICTRTNKGTMTQLVNRGAGSHILML